MEFEYTLGGKKHKIDFTPGKFSYCSDSFKPLGKLAMPSPELCVSVGQNGIGYLTPDMHQKYLLTFGLGPCIGVYTRNEETGAQTLAHISSNCTSKARAYARFVRERKLVSSDAAPFSNHSLIQILQSSSACDEDVSQIVSAFGNMGFGNTEVLRSSQGISIDVIYDSEGRMYDLTNPSLHMSDLDYMRMHAIAFSPNLHLTNENLSPIEDPCEPRLGDKYFEDRGKSTDSKVRDFLSELGPDFFKEKLYIKH